MTARPVRRLSAVLAGVGVLVSLTALPAQAKTSSPSQWGAKFCGGLTDWADTVTEIGNELQSLESDTPADGKAAIVDAIVQMGDATDDFYTTVKKAGNPDAKNGTKIEKTILKGINGIGDEITSMETLAQALPTTDQASFETAVQSLAAGFDSVSSPFDKAMTKVAKLDKDDGLSGELQKVKECKAIF